MYTGKKIDPDTGLYYFNARWYDPTLGKFITEDPIKDGVNWFSYVSNNPMTHVDPTGLRESESGNQDDDEDEDRRRRREEKKRKEEKREKKEREEREKEEQRKAEEEAIRAEEERKKQEKYASDEFQEALAKYLTDNSPILTAALAGQHGNVPSTNGLSEIPKEFREYLAPHVEGAYKAGQAMGSMLIIGAALDAPKAPNKPPQVADDVVDDVMDDAIQVTPDGVALPSGKTIPKDLVQNPYNRPGSFGRIDPATGRFNETLRIDPPTLPGYKGPNYSHFHTNGGKAHLTDLSKWPGGSN